MYPVFCRISNKVALTSTSSAVALNRIAPRPNNIIQPRELHNIGIVVVLEEWLGLQSCSKNWLELPPGLFLQQSAPNNLFLEMTYIVLFDDLLESGVVKLHEFGKVVDICNNVAEIFLQHHELLFGRHILIIGTALSADRASGV